MVAAPTCRRLFASLLLFAAIATTGCAASRGTDTPSGAKRPEAPAEQVAPFTVRQLRLPYRACSKPQRVGDSVYAAVTPDEDENGADSIVRYDMGTGLIESVIMAPKHRSIGWFAVNDRWLVWTLDRDLFAKPLSGGALQRLDHGRDLYAPALSGDLVAWDSLTKRRTHRIVVRDLASGESTTVGELALADLYNNFPAWDRNRLVWTDVVNDEGRYRVYDAGERTMREYPLADGAFRFPGYAQIEGDRLYSINFDSVDEWVWSRQRLGYYSTSERRFVPVVPRGFIANSFEVADGLLAVIDDNQQLTVASTGATAYDSGDSRPVKGPVDFVEASSDGSLIAWRESPDDDGSCTLYLIEHR